MPAEEENSVSNAALLIENKIEQTSVDEAVRGHTLDFHLINSLLQQINQVLCTHVRVNIVWINFFSEILICKLNSQILLLFWSKAFHKWPQGRQLQLNTFCSIRRDRKSTRLNSSH